MPTSATPPVLHSATLPAGRGPALLVHGGAWAIPGSECAAHRDGLREALERGRSLLEQGAPALEVACETVATMEAHGAFDAGRGAVLTREGHVELDAGLMDGTTGAYGAVAGVQRLAHPIRAARHLLEAHGDARILYGEGAERFAAGRGLPRIDNSDLICERERARYEALRERARYHPSHPFLPSTAAPRGTVGCVARDRTGRLAAATSTGGTLFRPSGRIGDSPIPGAGYYANAHAAASATGWGEAIAGVVLTARAIDRVEAGATPEAAAREVLQSMHARIANREGQGATGGLIMLSATGAGAWAFTTPRMARGGWQEGGALWVDA